MKNESLHEKNHPRNFLKIKHQKPKFDYENLVEVHKLIKGGEKIFARWSIDAQIEQ